MITYIITGGFLKGYRTYVLAGAAAIGVVAQYLVGDVSLTEAVSGLAMALGLGTLRAAS
jgi:hypothetical protein